MSRTRSTDAHSGFSAALRSILDAQDVRQADLARRVGVTAPSVADVLAKDNPSMLTAARYLSAVGYSVALVPAGKRLPDGSYAVCGGR